MIDIVKAVLDQAASESRRTPCKSNRASELGYAVPQLQGCLRRGVYARTAWAMRELPEPATLLVFREGQNQEAMVMRDLAAAGVTVIEQQSSFEWAEYNITGHLDGVLLDQETQKTYPLEVKSMAPHIYDTITEFASFKEYAWTRAYMAQITLYMLLKNVDQGVFLLKNKSTGGLKQVNVGLDYELGEWCIAAAEEINAAVAAGTLPEKIGDREACKRCPFKGHCLPEIAWGVPLAIKDDPDFEKRIARALELRPMAREYDSVWDLVRDEAKASMENGELNVVVGAYRLTGALDKRKALKLEIEKV
jgi:CRISPR/Cas system-associated exonuclease Cas4 (RecB family)